MMKSVRSLTDGWLNDSNQAHTTMKDALLLNQSPARQGTDPCMPFRCCTSCMGDALGA